MKYITDDDDDDYKRRADSIKVVIIPEEHDFLKDILHLKTDCRCAECHERIVGKAVHLFYDYGFDGDFTEYYCIKCRPLCSNCNHPTKLKISGVWTHLYNLVTCGHAKCLCKKAKTNIKPEMCKKCGRWYPPQMIEEGFCVRCSTEFEVK